MRTTLEDISRRTGFAKSTISIALRNDPRLPKSTVIKIQQAARELNYRPDPSLSMIASYRWRHKEEDRGASIGFVFDSKTPAHYVARELLHSVRERASLMGFRFDTFDIRDYRNGKSLSAILRNRGIQGIVVPPIYDETAFAGFEWQLFAGVCCDLGFWRPPYHLVTTDVFVSAQTAIQQVVEAGYRRIGAAFFLHPRTARDDAYRFSAALLEMDRLKRSGMVIDLLDSEPSDEQSFIHWVRSSNPEVIISLNNGTKPWLENAGYRVPEDIALACLVTRRGSKVTGAIPQYAQIGTTAAEMLDLAIQHHDFGAAPKPKTVLIKPVWSNRATLPRCR